MKARRTPAFRERRRFELKMEACASRTLRKYGYCDADVWSKEEREVAAALLSGLGTTAAEKRERLKNQGRVVDFFTWLWEDREPDLDGELAREVVRLAAGDQARQQELEWVAQRLLDRVRVRVVDEEEREIARALVARVPTEGCASDEVAWRRALLACAEELGGGDPCRAQRCRKVAELVAGRVRRRGVWDDLVEDDVPPEIQPLHISAVREAVGALIPDRLHSRLDEAVKRGKEDFGAVRVLHGRNAG